MGINRPLPASRPTEKSVSHLEAQHVGLEKPHICCHTLHAGQIGCSKARRTPRRASAQTGSQSGRAPARAGSGSPPAPATPFAAAGPPAAARANGGSARHTGRRRPRRRRDRPDRVVGREQQREQRGRAQRPPARDARVHVLQKVVAVPCSAQDQG